jgi:hypothetical protein
VILFNIKYINTPLPFMLKQTLTWQRQKQATRKFGLNIVKYKKGEI